MPWARHVRRRTLLAVAAAFLLGGCGGSNGAPVRVVIPSGASFGVAAESLARARVIGSPRMFRAYATALGRDRELKAGTYRLRRGSSYGDLIDALTKGHGLLHTVTIPEGFALANIAALLSRTLSVAPESVMAAVSDTGLRRRLDVPTPTIEGYLFPDTYSFPEGTTARQAVETMVQRFENVWKSAWDVRREQLAMSRHDIMSLAAIIEKEAKLPEERPVISAVYHNRLRKGMPLQADPTVQYALGRHVSRVLFRDLEIDSRYNTYKYAGLPPGPIASPGEASILAALYPTDAPYLYFVAHPDGHHEFRRTFSEHTAATREIRRDAPRSSGQTPGR